MGPILEWIFAMIGTSICVAGAIAVASWQPQNLWPMPGLVLIEWAVLGTIGFVAVVLDTRKHLPRWGNTLWAVCGALISLTVFGALSIGPIVLLSVLAFGGAGILGSVRQNRKVGVAVSMLAVSFVANFALLFVFVLLGRT